MAGIIFSAVSRTRRIDPPKQVIKVTGIQDLMRGGTPRYEYFRGEQGDTILDLTDQRGIEDLGDRVRVLPGTPWADLLKYNLEVFGLEDTAVGGSVHFEDGGFGFNEFGPIRKRVEVEGVINGQEYRGPFRGGVISAVIIRKDPRPLSYMKLDRSFDFVLNRVKYWFSTGIPPFRDITIWKKGNSTSLLVAFPLSRQELLKDKLEEMSPTRPYSFSMGNYRFRYFGSVKTMDLDSPMFSEAEELILFVRKDITKFVALSNKPLNLSLTLDPFSDTSSQDLFSGCILCGKCVNVCPHASQRGDKDYSPMGFFVSGMQKEYANCHLCGKCDEVCPASLNIVSKLREKATFRKISLDISLSLPSRKSLVITPISRELVENAIKIIGFFYRQGIKLGIITLNVSLDELIRGSELNVPEGVEELYVLTPEERLYLLSSKPKTVTDVYFLFDVLPSGVRSKILSKRVHKTCMYKGTMNGDEKCSFAFLEMLNGEPSTRSEVSSQVTLCPLASKKLGIPSYIDELEEVKVEDADKLVEEISGLLTKNKAILEDLTWYDGLDDSIRAEFIRGLLRNYIFGKDPATTIKMYVKLLQENALEDNEIKSILVEEIKKAISADSLG
ncbi:4Fe-4S dicluster domain-containing protein [Metallosphaera javensis (ex Sakai et al. 2022)]|uniref:4Fe-4S dicluster domain-containing protein n=1 Tax=Metallosphaera javensis (ex Sakai et al. 2022) TaxID=2775498 RepID=UPI00258D28C2|nr:MAG: hypothetical protein MjAS7_1299 [Metallosphaera javensis (ex Sakai et al. 2022)]